MPLVTAFKDIVFNLLRSGECRKVSLPLADSRVAKFRQPNTIVPTCEYVDDESRLFEGVEEHHVTEATVRQRRTKHGNLVLRRPIVNRILVVDLSAESRYHFRRRPQCALRDAKLERRNK